MAARLIEALATTEPLAELFSDRSVLQAMLDFEAALARAEARVGQDAEGTFVKVYIPADDPLMSELTNTANSEPIMTGTKFPCIA